MKVTGTDHALPRDVPRNAIVTPERFISMNPPYPKPRGIYWELLSIEKIEAIPVLRERASRRGQ